MGSEILFFLGAGASVPGGVPDTVQFVRESEKHWPVDSGAHRVATG